MIKFSGLNLNNILFREFLDKFTLDCYLQWVGTINNCLNNRSPNRKGKSCFGRSITSPWIFVPGHLKLFSFFQA
jgi:hypothetical protein